jgi:hypothetical protein
MISPKATMLAAVLAVLVVVLSGSGSAHPNGEAYSPLIVTRDSTMFFTQYVNHSCTATSAGTCYCSAGGTTICELTFDSGTHKWVCIDTSGHQCPSP